MILINIYPSGREKISLNWGGGDASNFSRQPKYCRLCWLVGWLVGWLVVF